MSRDFDYEKNNRCINSLSGEDEIKCKNYELCEHSLSEWWFECKGKYICINCDMFHGNVNEGILKIFKSSDQCPICLEENKNHVAYPNCNHGVCVDCFPNLNGYFNSDYSKYPVFPYPRIEKDFDKDPGNPKWIIEYPLIKQYVEDENKWYEEEEHLQNKAWQNKNTKCLRLCSICRA